jgi:tetratricopeptide (TPR) repeat protein
MTAAARHLERALALEPANLLALRQAAFLSSSLGRLQTAIAVCEYAVARDPLDPSSHGYLGWLYMLAGRLDEAFVSARTNLKLSPDSIGGHFDIAVVMLLQGDAKSALNELQQELDKGSRLTGLALAHHALGQASESDAALDELIVKHERSWSESIARVYAFRGEVDEAFEWLDKAVANRDTGVANIPNQPFLHALHSDPRWLPFLRKIGKAPEQLAAIKFEVRVPTY